ncbi:hypothetical protein C5167_011237 [Papaver somniferum]|uniref:FRIGIDA-like protein n=1 Tax=Papaver somniferum TaxID=3469 RepID=A0A4Y7K3Q0_PAPSO|nr:FRIGIDA-like protein 3 [Papaver somniferum]RZC67547.1 hypothetical protein C5167_011237 [Papaver somniferum]
MVECLRSGQQNSTNLLQVEACQKCGVSGYADLLVYCDVCQISAEHVYCLDTISKVTQKVVQWSCEQCVPLYFHKQISLRPSQIVEETNGKQLRDNDNVYAHRITDHPQSVENLLPNSQLNQQTLTDDAEAVRSISKKSFSEQKKRFCKQEEEGKKKKFGKALVEQEAQTNVSVSNVQYKEIEEYFEDKTGWLKNKFNELEVIEKAFVEKKSEMRALIAKKVATVDVEEQAMLDRVQEQEDIAVAAIIGARKKIIANRVATVKEQAMLDRVQEQKGIGVIEAQNNSSIHTVGCLDRQQCLRQFCQDMDAKSLMNYIMEHKNYMGAVCGEIPVALKSAPEPAHLVLDLLKGFYPSPGPATSCVKESRRDSEDRECIHRSCLMLIESVAPLVLGGDELLDHKTKRRAKVIADDWKFRLGSCDPTCRNSSLDVEVFLKLLTVFKITTEIDEEELCKFVLAVSHRLHIPDLCHSLGLTNKIPVLVEGLISRRRQIDAVHFVQAFKLEESFPPAPLLQTYLRDLRRDIQIKNTSSGGDVRIKKKAHMKELAAIKSVIKCIEKYKLEADYPLYPLRRRLIQLEDWRYNEKRRMCGDLMINEVRKKARVDDGRKYESYRHPLDPLAYSKRNLSLHRNYRMEPSSPRNSH